MKFDKIILKSNATGKAIELRVLEQYPVLAVFDEEGDMLVYVRRYMMADEPDKYDIIHCAQCIDKYRQFTRAQLEAHLQDYLFGMTLVNRYDTDHILIPSLSLSDNMLRIHGIDVGLTHR